MHHTAVLLLLFGLVNIQAGINGLPNILNPPLRAKRAAGRCGEDLTATSGTITLPTEDYNGTQLYRAKNQCHWTITVPEGNHVTLVSEYFSLELSDNCMFDYVEIEEQGDQPLTTRYCGWKPLEYISYSNQLTIRFRSDESYEDRGFSLSYTTPKPNSETRCNNTGDADKFISNEGSYCVYRLQAPENQVVELVLNSINFGSRTCEEERIDVYSSVSSHGERLSQICSETLPGVLRVRARNMFLRYTRQGRKEPHGFEMSYKFVEDNFTPPPTPPTTPSPVGGNNDCSGRFKDRQWVYSPPQYENNKHCVIVVRNTLLRQHVIQVKFNKFELEDSTDCKFDSVKVYSGERSDSRLLGKPYCGTSLKGRTFITNGNSLRIEFTTDESLAFLGLQAEITYIPTRTCSCDSNEVCVRKGFEKLCIKGGKCGSNSCENGGTCVVTRTSQQCYCPPGFTGDRCQDGGDPAPTQLHFTIAPMDRKLARDAPHTEQCQVDAPKSGIVDYRWMFEGEEIEEYNPKTGFGMHPGGLLQIDQFTEQMEGLYACVAETRNTTSEHTFEYSLVENCLISIVRGPKPERMKVGEMAILPCSSPRAKTIRWTKDDKPIDFNNNGRFSMMVNYYLQIRDLQVEDEGVYKCIAEDDDGCSTHREGKLTVLNVKPLNTYCGLSVYDEHLTVKSLVSKGVDARPRENPWHVIFKTDFSDRTIRNSGFCGGTLISQRFVLTAAHCIHEFTKIFKKPWNNQEVLMIFGTTQCKTKDDNAIERKPKSYIIHEDYFKQRSFQDSDIALIELDSPVEYNDSVRPICIEPISYNMKVFFEDRTTLQAPMGRVAGCGQMRGKGSRPKILQVVSIPYKDWEVCDEAFADEGHTITDTMICAGRKVGRTGDTCSGDSGGSLIMATNARWVQTGIVSWGVGCDKKGVYGVYTNVGVFYDWIQNITKFDEEEVPDFLNLD